VNALTPELLAGPTYELMKGSCNSLTELEYHLEEVYKAMTDQLDWVNPEGQQYPYNLLQPLSLIPDNQGRRVIPFAHFINNDLEYLWGATCRRSSTESRKLPEEAQPYQARHVSIRSEATGRSMIDGTLNDVRNALDDRLNGDKDRAAAMIQAIDKMLKIRRIMRSLERFVRGRLYEGDFRMLQRTI
nr:hypothetical protein [Tanacetum cinerariifolium]